MKLLTDVFAPLIGQLAWNVRRGMGTFVTMEFGEPHLLVREPVATSTSASDKVRRDLMQRRVSVIGSWHFWIKHCEWRLSSAELSLSHDTCPNPALETPIRDLDGQRLVSFEHESDGSIFKFDHGAKLELRPSSEISDDQWTLYCFGGENVSMRGDGSLASENVEK